MIVLEWTLIVGIVLSLALCTVALIRAFKEGFTRRWIAVLVLGLGFLFIIYVAYNSDKIEPAAQAQIMLMVGLLAVTGVYALSAARQADASVKMAKEMREQRYDSVRPVVDIRRKVVESRQLNEALAAREENFQYGLSCVLHNVGLGPAIDMYSFIQVSEAERQRYDFGTLAIGEKTLPADLSLNHNDNQTALITYYKDVYGRTFKSRREVSVDKEKGWELGPLQVCLVEENKPK